MEEGVVVVRFCESEEGLEEIRIAADPWLGARLATEPALFLEEMQEDEPAEQGLDEIADRLVRLVLLLVIIEHGNFEDFPGLANAGRCQQMIDEGLVVEFVFLEEVLRERLDGEGFFDIGKREVVGLFQQCGEA